MVAAVATDGCGALVSSVILVSLVEWALHTFRQISNLNFKFGIHFAVSGTCLPQEAKP